MKLRQIKKELEWFVRFRTVELPEGKLYLPDHTVDLRDILADFALEGELEDLYGSIPEIFGPSWTTEGIVSFDYPDMWGTSDSIILLDTRGPLDYLLGFQGFDWNCILMGGFSRKDRKSLIGSFMHYLTDSEVGLFESLYGVPTNCRLSVHSDLISEKDAFIGGMDFYNWLAKDRSFEWNEFSGEALRRLSRPGYVEKCLAKVDSLHGIIGDPVALKEYLKAGDFRKDNLPHNKDALYFLADWVSLPES